MNHLVIFGRVPSFAAIFCFASLELASAAAVTMDPAPPLTNYWAGGEWNTDGNFENWTTTQITNVAVTNGVLSGSASGNDAQISLLNFAGGPDLDLGFYDQLELRIQVSAAYTNDIQIFYGVTNTPGINTSTRVLTITNASIPKDGAFHVYRFDMGLEIYWRGNLRDLRVDPLASAPGETFALDYLRVGDLAGDIYYPRYSANNPAPGANDTLGLPVSDLESKHFRVIWDASAPSNSFWRATMPHGTLRNLEEVFAFYTKSLGYREPTQSWTPASRNGKKYKVNLTMYYGGYFAGGDPGDFGWLNITPDGLQVDPPTWVIPHEFMHVCQMHQNPNGAQNMDGIWWEGHANYGRERWLNYYTNLYSNQSGIDANYLQSAHMIVAHGRDYYLSWPFFVYLDENPDGLPDLGEGTVARLWQTNTSGVYLYNTLDQQTAVTPLKDIVGYFARRELTFDYRNQSAITNALNTQNPTVWKRFQLTELIRRGDDTNWWRVPMEIAPMQGAYATHELVPPGSGAGRVVAVNFHGLPDAQRGADWRASFIAISDTGVERYTPLWNAGSNSVTLAANENHLYLAVAGTPDQFIFTGHDDLQYPYRSHASKQRLHYEVQVFGATPKESNNGSTAGLVQHPNGLGWKASSATVDSTAYLAPNARVLDSARVRGNARIEDYAVVRGSAVVTNNAVVSGHALVWENAVVKQNAKVRDWAIISGSAVVTDNARGLEHAQIQGGLVSDYATAKGSAILWSGSTNGGYGVIDGDFMAARFVTNGFAFGHLPYTGVPDSWVRTAPDRLYAAYEFNIGEKNDSMARDLIGVTDGYLIGGPAWKTNDAGHTGALSFNGGNQYVALDKSLCDFKEWSLTLWMKWNGGSAGQPAVFLGSATNRCLFVTPDDGSGQIKFVIRGNALEQTLSGSNAVAGAWTHVAVTLSNGVGKIYCNGVLTAQGSVTITPDQLLGGNTNAAPQHYYLARGADASAPFFNGSLDGVRVYSKALSGAEVTALATLPSPNAGTVYVDLRASNPGAGAAVWTNRGTLGNFTRVGTPSLVANVAGSGVPGVSFNGLTFAYAGPNSVADIDGSSDRSIEVWAYNQSLAVEETMVSWGHRGTTRGDMGFNFGNSTGWGAATLYNDDLSWGSTAPSANAWHYLVFTCSNLVAKVYVDGVLVNTKTLGGALATFAGEPINLACQRDTANGTRSFYFSGYLNMVRIHGGTLTDDQVAANYALGPALNQPPALTAISNRVIGAGVTLTVTNTAADPDTPPQTLNFSLLNPPTGAVINTNTGILTWRPAVALADSTNQFVVKVADNGTPVLSATQSFLVTVSLLNLPTLDTVSVTSGQFTFHVSGDFGPDYTIQASTNLTDWTTRFTTNAASFDWSDPNPPLLPAYFIACW